MLVTPAVAFVRPPSASYASCLRSDAAPIDVDEARAQHAGYVRALRDAGVEIVMLLPEDELPDAMFVEDTAVIVGDRALITRPGAPSRRGETSSVRAALATRLEVVDMQPPAQLDGGDVLRVGDALLVGLSQRTNREGIDALRGFASELGLSTHTVELHAGLHLKSACSLADASTLLVFEGAFRPGALPALDVEVLKVSEPAGANMLAFDRRVLVSAAAPRTAELLANRGLRPIALELSQIHAGDGALSCLSLRVAPPGHWVV
jgi:dimethylargininase